MPSHTSEPIKIFVSSCIRDKNLCAELNQHLEILKRQGWIEAWHDGQIRAGEEWEKEIETHLNSAQIILLLISSDFLASEYCYHNELMRALERHDQNEACVIPIILRPCDWDEAPFGKLQALPKGAVPVTSWMDRDEAFLSVTRGIRQTIEQLKREYQRKLEQIEQEEEQQEQRRLQQIREEQERRQQEEIQRERLAQREEQRRAQQFRDEQEEQRRVDQARSRSRQEAQRQSEQTRLWQASSTQQFQRLPWVSLLLILLIYALLGFMLAAFVPPRAMAVAAVLAVTAVLAVAGGVAVAGARGMAMAGAVLLLGVGAGSVARAGAGAGAVAKVLAGPAAMAMAMAGAGAGIAAADKLSESFSKLQVFLILAATSTIGLALGALISWITHR